MMSRKKTLNPQGDVILRNEAIQWVTKAKFLGVIVDQHLNWKDHISMVSHKISQSCNTISRIRNTFDIESKKLIYYNLIHPYLTSCIYICLVLYLSNKFKNPMYSPKEVSACTFCYCMLSSLIRAISSSIKTFCLWINWLINKKIYLLKG